MNALISSVGPSLRLIARMARAAVFLAAAAAFSVAQAAPAIVHNFLPPVVQYLGGSFAPSTAEVAYRVDVPAGDPLTATRIEFAFGGTANAGAITGRIYSHNAETNIPGAVLASATNALPFSGSGEHVAVIDLATPFVLQPGTTYWVACTGATGDSAGFVFSAVSGPGLFPPTAQRGFPGGSNDWTAAASNSVGFAFRFGAPHPLPRKGAAFLPLADATYSLLFSPASSDSDLVAFRATIAGENVTKATNSVIVTYNLDTIIVARTGSPAPGGLGSFSKLGDPVINAAGEVAFSGVLKKGAGVTGADDLAIWTSLGGALELALREGASAPGLPNSQRFRRVEWFHLGDDLLYLCAGTGGGGPSRTGIWSWNGTTLTKLIATGDPITLGGTTTTVKSFNKPASTSTGNAQSRVSSPGGRLALLVTGANRKVQMVQF